MTAASAATGTPPSDQSEVIALLQGSDAYPDLDTGQQVTRIDTHAAHLFLAGHSAWKLKRAVRFSYLDQSTPQRRRRLCERELELNRATLPDIYLEVVPVTRESDGRLSLAGSGKPVDWLLHMRRFDQALVLDEVTMRGELDDALARELGASVASYHVALPPVIVDDGAARVREVIDELALELGRLDAQTGQPRMALRTERFARAARAVLDCQGALLDARGRSGFVRRCHGDLHLRNLVLQEGVPVPFDALEFDERMATTDVLYDLAFLLMDLVHRGEKARANLVLNAWLPSFDVDALQGLATLPLFVAMRAAIRAMTSAQATMLQGSAHDGTVSGEADAYLRLALDALEPWPPRLFAIAGLSGTGKSTVAQALAPELHPIIGAVLLRSDVERKSALGMKPTMRLPAAAYTAEAGDRNHDRLLQRARVALDAGLTVVIDSVLHDAGRRRSVEALARRAGVAFVGLWLDAPIPVLEARLDARRNDASDADAGVMHRQALEQEPIDGWQRVDAAGTLRHSLSEVRSALLRSHAAGAA